MTTLLWVLLVLCMSFVPSNYTALLFPLLILITIWPYRIQLINWLIKNRYIILYQAIIGFGYFLYHRNDILRLELWSDEIFSLTIASNPFQSIAKVALNKSVIPPFHYWELWMWLNLFSHIPAHLIEFMYRVPSMIYHIASSILFANLICLKMHDKSEKIKNFTNFLLFAAFYFNPLLYPFALEIRPYAAMIFASVITLYAIESKEIYSLRYIPVQLTFFITSFFFPIFYIPVFIFQFFSSSKKLVAISLMAIGIIYLSFVPFLRVPNQTSQIVINIAVERTLGVITSIFISGIIPLIIWIIAATCILRNKNNILYLLQILFIWIYSICSALLIRYQAFAPRHLIISIPVILYLLCIPVFQFKRIHSYIWLVILCVFFISPWIRQTESMNSKLTFAPKISIGIKRAIEKALQYNLPITLSLNTLEQDNPLFYTYKYFEEVSLWYIQRYKLPDPQRISNTQFCINPEKPPVYLISFSKPDCMQYASRFTVLHFSILEN